jgi:ABC-2 type transport system permease protein
MNTFLSQLKKNFMVMRLSWEAQFAYPVGFWIWRLRQVLLFVIMLSLWEAVYQSTASPFGYSKDQMLTYLFIANILQFIVLSSRTIEIGSIIWNGDLSNYLVKPIRFFWYWFSRDIADKLQNIMFAVVELSVLYLIFQPHLVFPSSFLAIFLTFLTAFGGLLLYYYFNLLFGFIGFWSPDIWAPRFMFMMLLQFTTGWFFPLDIFPSVIVKILSFTPFPYFLFFSTQIWLEKLSLAGILQGSAIMCIWILLLYALARTVWRRGLRGYGAEGK